MNAMSNVTRRDQIDMVSLSSSGIDDVGAEQACDAIIEKIKTLDENFRLRTIRYLPNTVSEVPEKNLMEVVANLTVNIGSEKSKFGFIPSTIIQAVISFNKLGDRMSLNEVSIFDAEFVDDD